MEQCKTENCTLYIHKQQQPGSDNELPYFWFYCEADGYDALERDSGGPIVQIIPTVRESKS